MGDRCGDIDIDKTKQQQRVPVVGAIFFIANVEETKEERKKKILEFK